MIHAVLRELSYNFSNFPRAVGFAIVQIPWEWNVRGETCQSTGSASDGHVRPGDIHARANDVAAIDRIAQSNVAQSAISPHVAHGGEAGFQHGTCIGHGF